MRRLTPSWLRLDAHDDPPPEGEPADADELSANPPEPPNTEPPGDEPADAEDDPAARARREAHNLRERLRATEAERDTAAGALDGMRRREAARLAGEQLANGADLFDLGAANLADLLDDAGEVDPEKVRTAAEALLHTRGRYLGRVGTPRESGMSAGGTPVETENTPTWASALRRQPVSPEG